MFSTHPTSMKFMVNICLLNKKKSSFCVLKGTALQFIVKKSLSTSSHKKKAIEKGNQLFQN